MASYLGNDNIERNPCPFLAIVDRICGRLLEIFAVMSLNISPGYGLALHTTSRELGLAIAKEGEESRSQHWDLDRELSNYLHYYLAEFIHPQTWQDLSYIAVAKGPGSFTSTRIGLVTARTLGQQLKIPVFSFSSLLIYAESLAAGLAPHQVIAVEMPATRGQLYGGIYQRDSEQWLVLNGDRLWEPGAWYQHLAELSGELSLIQTPEKLGYSAKFLLSLAQHAGWQGQRPDWSTALPFYGN